MSKYARKRKKKPVAKRATVEQRCKLSPPPESLKSLPDARSVLHIRNGALSLSDISWELGGVNRGTLSGVINGKREPSAKLIKKINSVYGCHLHQKQVKITVEVCPACDAPNYTPRHRCPGAPSKYAPHPVMRVSKIKRILNSPYKDS